MDDIPFPSDIHGDARRTSNDVAMLEREFDLCHAKIAAAVEHLARIELYALVGVGAVYAWYFTVIQSDNAPGLSVWPVLWIPVVLSALACYRGIMQVRYIAAVARYIQHLESALLPRWPHRGFESWFAKEGPKTWNRLYRWLIWPGLIAATTVFALAGSEAHVAWIDLDPLRALLSDVADLPDTLPRS